MCPDVSPTTDSWFIIVIVVVIFIIILSVRHILFSDNVKHNNLLSIGENHVKRLSVNPENDKIAANIEVAFIDSTKDLEDTQLLAINCDATTTSAIWF